MAYLSIEQTKKIIEGRPEGSTPSQVLDNLVRQGHTIEGLKVPTAPKKQNMFQELGEDIAQAGQGIREDLNRRLDNTTAIEQGQARGEQGFFRSLAQRVGQGAGFVSDIIGRGIVGAGKALLPESAERAIGGVATDVAESALSVPAVQDLIGRYQEVQRTNPALARDIDAALGLGSLALDVGTAGVTGRGIKKVGQTTGSTARGGANLGVRVGQELQGALSGTSQETLEQAFDAVVRGGKNLDVYKSALRSQLTPEGLVDNVRQAIDEVARANNTNYRNVINSIGDNIVDTSGVANSFGETLAQFGIRISDDGLDFSKSALRNVPEAKNKLNTVYDEIRRIGDQQTLKDLDTTRQSLRELKFVGSDASANRGNAIIDSAIVDIKKAGRQIDGYDDLLKTYAEDAEFIDEIRRSLSSGDRATVDTAYRKLATSLKTNNERRMNLIRELDNATDGAILANIAGQQLSETLPRGLIRQISAGLAFGSIVTGGSLPATILPMLLFASPRVTGEVILALGLGAQKTKIITNTINNLRKALPEEFLVPPAAVLKQVEIPEDSIQDQQNN